MKWLVAIGVGIVAVGLLWVLNAPTTVSLGQARYAVPKSAQFAFALRSRDEVPLMLRGKDLAAHVPGYLGTSRTYDGLQGPADTPVIIFPKEKFDAVQSRETQTVQIGPSVERRVLFGQEEALPSCFDSHYQDGGPYRTCLFTYRDGGVTVSFWLSGDNLPAADGVARYAVKVLERYRKG